MRIILGVTGCIAAYKAAILLRLLCESGADVVPVMTKSAHQFLGKLTLEKLSGHKVISDLFEDHTPKIKHIDLARNSDLLAVVPATANILAKFANGIADDFLTTLYISTTTPIVVAPAMNVEMWRHPATQNNLRILAQRGVTIIQPDSGYLACGEVGLGRLAKTEIIVQNIFESLKSSKQLEGLKVLVTAGPTVEDIDPVRFLSNRSSGKMGFALAEEAQKRGARVTLVSGPTYLPSPTTRHIQVRSAKQMEEAVLDRFKDNHITIMAAAVADFTPAQPENKKIKKQKLPNMLVLNKTNDILYALGRHKQNDQTLIGFAAETEDLPKFGLKKLKQKRLDLIFVNDVSKKDRGFSSTQNQVLCLDRLGHQTQSSLLPKPDIARFVWDQIQHFRQNLEPSNLKSTLSS